MPLPGRWAFPAAATGLYLISLQVAAERGRLEATETQIALVHADMRRLNTELGTRASQRQLEQWNGEVLALSAPKANQFLQGRVQLASLDGSVLDRVAGPAQLVAVNAKVQKPAPRMAPPVTAARPAADVAGNLRYATYTPEAAAPAGRAPAPVVRKVAFTTTAPLTEIAKPLAKAKPNDVVAAGKKSVLQTGTLASLAKTAARRRRAVTALAAAPDRPREGADRHQTLLIAHQRLMMLLLLFAFASLVVVARLLQFGIFGDDDRGAVVARIAARGDIVDRNGQVLAQTIDAWSVGIHANTLLTKPEDLAPKLAALMPEKSAAEYLAILKSKTRFTYLRRRALPELVAQINALGEPSIEFAREPQRLYPQGSLATHVLGYADFEGARCNRAGAQCSTSACAIRP